MNIPTVLKEFGCLRNLWEGGYKGEGIIKKVKPIIHQFTRHWHVKLVQNFYQNQSIELIINELNQKDTSTVIMKMYYIYKSIRELNKAIATKKIQFQLLLMILEIFMLA